MKKRSAIKEAILAKLIGKEERGVVVSLSGPWGSGKTHLWREIEMELRGQPNAPPCVYASLFGAVDVGDIKSILFNETILNPVVDKHATQAAQQVKKATGWIARNLPGLLKLADNAIGTDLISKNVDLTRYIPFSTIICLDDLERASESVRIEDVLGLANYLSEQRRCRLVLIMNEDHLAERYPKYETLVKAYRERVVSASVKIRADIPSVFDFFATPRSQSSTPETRTQIISHMDRVSSDNLRTLARIIERIDHVGDTTSSVLTPNHVAFVCALTVEDSEGKLQSQAFYEFHPAIVKFQLKEKLGTPDDAKRLAFHSRHFDGSSADYSFSPTLYDYVANGLLDRSTWKQEVENVVRSPIDDADRLMRLVYDLRFRFFNDQEHEKFIGAVRDLFTSSGRASAREIKTLFEASFLGAAWSRRPLPSDMYELAEYRIITAAREGDGSLDPTELLASRVEPVRRLINRYLDERKLVGLQSLQTQLYDLIWAGDLPHITALLTRPEHVAAGCSLQILAELHATKSKDRRFYFTVLHALARNHHLGGAEASDNLRTYVALLQGQNLENSDEPILEEVLQPLGLRRA